LNDQEIVQNTGDCEKDAKQK